MSRHRSRLDARNRREDRYLIADAVPPIPDVVGGANRIAGHDGADVGFWDLSTGGEFNLQARVGGGMQRSYATRDCLQNQMLTDCCITYGLCINCRREGRELEGLA